MTSPDLQSVAPRPRWRAGLEFAILVAAIIAAYGPVYRAGFIWDDEAHVTRPDLRSLHGLLRIWTRIGATQQYYPALHSAFWAEHRLWGDAALGYHLVNVGWHVLAAVLFVLVLRRLQVPGALLGGFLFGLHPVGVESVAWISEQKNTLSTVFFLGAVLVYLRFDERRRLGAYAGALALFGLAVLTKTVTATLPAVLLVILWWRRGRLDFRRDVWPLLPWFGFALVGGLTTAWVEGRFIGAKGAHFDLSLMQRVLVAGRAVVFYLAKLAWPTDLMFFYPRWHPDPGLAWQYLFPVGVIAGLVFLFQIRRRTRAPLAAALGFVGMLFPALGFFNVYPFVFSYVADHFQYLASLSAFALAAAGVATLGRRLAGGARLVFGGLGLAMLALLAAATWRQASTYGTLETLYRVTLARNPEAWLAHDNLGVILAATGRLDEAIPHYEQALRLNPDYPETYNNLGNARARRREWPAALENYARALQLRPGFAEAASDWAHAEYQYATDLGNAGRVAKAIDHYRQAVRLRPDYEEAHANLGLALAYAGRLAEAADEYRAALRLNPADGDARIQFEAVLRDLGAAPR